MTDTDFIECFCNNIQRTRNVIRRSVVVDCECRAGFGTRHCCCESTCTNHIGIESFVQSPPNVLQNFSEISRIFFRCSHAACQSRINVMMTYCKRFRYQFSFTIYNFGFGIEWKVLMKNNFTLFSFLNFDMTVFKFQSYVVDISSIFQDDSHFLKF